MFWESTMLIEFGVLEELLKVTLTDGTCTLASINKYVLASAVDSMELLKIINFTLEMEIGVFGKGLTAG